MNEADNLRRENEALRDCLSRLSEASLRITEDLDLDTVLQGVVDGARSLTGARMGGITTLDESGQLQDFMHLRCQAGGASAVPRTAGRTGVLRLSEQASRTAEAGGLLRPHDGGGPARDRPAAGAGGELPGRAHPSPGRARRQPLSIGQRRRPGVRAGGRGDPGDVCVPAALVIANARRHREEQRARADLETLITTAPVGVVVFDARTGVPVSFNREARRVVGNLRMAGGSEEQLLNVLTFRRADGRAISLEEFPLAQALSTGETVRAEEIVMQAPDGRSVTTIVNVTPIYSEEGEVESVVVTLQDMTPLEEMKRLRAEFLGVVNHHLLTPLTTIEGSATTLLDDASSLDAAEMRQFHRIIVEQSDNMRYLISDLLDVARIETGTLPVAPEPSDDAVLVDEARNTFVSGWGRNDLHIDLQPDLPMVMADRRRIVQVLSNLLSNASRHSPESSPIRVSAVREGIHVEVSVADDGGGVEAERLPHLFRRFSRLAGEDGRRELGRSGLGLAICKGIVEAHGGRIWAESDGPGLGARFTFTIPVVEEAATAPPRLSAPSRQQGEEGARILAVDG